MNNDVRPQVLPMFVILVSVLLWAMVLAGRHFHAPWAAKLPPQDTAVAAKRPPSPARERTPDRTSDARHAGKIAHEKLHHRQWATRKPAERPSSRRPTQKKKKQLTLLDLL
ncbi:MAG: hypothetical protein D6704_04775 [Nitrospirae bacterium]|nr:MAG: hypothetical protein D6704_04775 [Nitrospirota bacterium]